nr:PREDICTED: G-protein coupled receptor 56-like isoform X2 [Lepisosteus oculatus]
MDTHSITVWLLPALLLTSFASGHMTQTCACNESIEDNGTIPENPNITTTCCWMAKLDKLLDSPSSDTTTWVKRLETVLETTTFPNNTPDDYMSMKAGKLVAFLHRVQRQTFKGLSIYADWNTTSTKMSNIKNCKARVDLPQEILTNDEQRTIVFCMYKANFTANILHNQAVGVSVSNTTVSGLKNPINITIFLEESLKANQIPKCVFLDFTATDNHWKDYGCKTVKHEDYINCSCDHLTYFAVLLVSASVSQYHLKILTIISKVGSGISLVFLIVTIILYIVGRRTTNDNSLKIHINLATALILLNVHFLPSEEVAALRNDSLCRYVAILLHYSLLCTFTWMAIEGFHLYILLCKVFSIYIRKYILKLCLVGWDKDVYGLREIPTSEDNGTSIFMCYINNITVNYVTSLCLFVLVFLFNLIMLSITVSKIMSMRSRKTPGENRKAFKDICGILGITCLLGTSWGLVFLSFGPVNLPSLYLFSILNSLQDCPQYLLTSLSSDSCIAREWDKPQPLFEMVAVFHQSRIFFPSVLTIVRNIYFY